MPERKKKIIQGLVSDGLTTAYHSYKLLDEEKVDLGLIYLTQANTFITAAKTLYYEYEYLFPEAELQFIFSAFGNYNNLVLTYIRTKKDMMDQVSKAYKQLFHEYTGILNWINNDLAGDTDE
ncbi:hypothetical protein ACOJIU_19255 (plasmid) [Carnobacterium maltaromaticum]